MIPIQVVESALLEAASVADVAVVGDPDGQGGELACAVITRAPPVTVDEPRTHLLDQDMTD